MLRLAPACAALALLAPAALAQTRYYVFDGDLPDMQLGKCVSALGDLNGDGAPDIGGSGAGPLASSPGCVSAASGLQGFPYKSVFGAVPGDAYGHRHCALPDIDLDGVPDMAGLALHGGYVRLLSGTGLVTLAHVGASGAESLIAAGDVDQDGVQELLVGFPQAGRVELWSGVGAQLQLSVQGPTSFGGEVLGLDDLDGDGALDFAVGAPQAAGGTGAVHLLSGQDGGNLATLLGSVAGGGFGQALARAGDLNADGRTELLVSAPAGDGRVSVYDPTTQALLHTHLGAPGLGLGSALAGGVDLTGDGLADHVARAGDAVRAYSGADFAPFAQVDGPAGQSYGSSLALATDYSGDGLGELIVGDWMESAGGLHAGRVEVLSLEDLALGASAHLLRLSHGGLIQLELAAGAEQAHKPFLLLGSLSGTSPPLGIEGVSIPLAVDAYFDYVLSNPGAPPYVGSPGFTDAAGAGSLAFALPPLSPPELAWNAIHQAVVVIEPTGVGLASVTNAVPIALIP